MIASPLIFYVFAGLAIVCSLMVVLKKNPVSSAFSLVLVFFAFAGIYAMLDAHLIAAFQVLVYAGAIMVLFVFVIMLLNADVPSLDYRRTTPEIRWFAAIMCVALLWGLIWTFKESPPAIPIAGFSPQAIESQGGNTRVLAEVLFSDYVYPFELTSVLLLAAIVGAIAVAKRKQKGVAPGSPSEGG